MKRPTGGYIDETDAWRSRGTPRQSAPIALGACGGGDLEGANDSNLTDKRQDRRVRLVRRGRRVRPVRKARRGTRAIPDRRPSASASAPTIRRGSSRARSPAATFADGPLSGTLISGGLVGGTFPSQPVQGMSSLVDARDGTFLSLADNGYGSLDNSADFNLRVYRIRPNFKTAHGGPGDTEVESFIQLHDPDHRIKFAIVNEFNKDRVLTGADFDVESLRVAPDGTLWIGDEFGPFLLHFDQTGRLLHAPFPLCSIPIALDNSFARRRTYFEEASSVRIMNAASAHAHAHGSVKTPVFRPGTCTSSTPTRTATAASTPSATTRRAGHARPRRRYRSSRGQRRDRSAHEEPRFARVPQYPGRRLQGRHLDGERRAPDARAAPARRRRYDLDRPDLLYQTIASSTRTATARQAICSRPTGSSTPRSSTPGHRGGRNPAGEHDPGVRGGARQPMTTLEMDCGLTLDNVPVMYHDRDFQGRFPGSPRSRAASSVARFLFTSATRRWLTSRTPPTRS